MLDCQEKACTECQVEWALLQKVIETTNKAVDMKPNLKDGSNNIEFGYIHLQARKQWRALMDRTKAYYLKKHPCFQASADLYDSNDLDRLEELLKEEEEARKHNV